MNTPTPENPSITKPSSKGLLLAIIALCCVIILAVLVVYWGKLLKSEVRHLQRFSLQQQQLIMQLQNNLQALNQPQQKKVRALTEVEYILRTANFDLEFQGDVPTAIRLLQTADAEVATLEDPTLLPIRQSLAAHLASLQTANKLDLTGILLQLDAISDKINQLPLITGQLQTPNANTKSSEELSTSQPMPAWRRALEASEQALKNVIVVRQLDQPVKPLLKPEEQALVVQNIQQKLSQAEWAVMHGQPLIYQKSLQGILNLIHQYFAENAPVTQNVLQTITDLQKINIKPHLPDISNTLKLIQDDLNNKQPALNKAPSVNPGSSTS